MGAGVGIGGAVEGGIRFGDSTLWSESASTTYGSELINDSFDVDGGTPEETEDILYWKQYLPWQLGRWVRRLRDGIGEVPTRHQDKARPPTVTLLHLPGFMYGRWSMPRG